MKIIVDFFCGTGGLLVRIIGLTGKPIRQQADAHVQTLLFLSASAKGRSGCTLAHSSLDNSADFWQFCSGFCCGQT
ncbi:MAG: hypothetical protein JO084_15335 [Bradyrhizobiaceae bacterium]|nr:hypothetical protein [Bradyrhizobiaceae bacterium]